LGKCIQNLMFCCTSRRREKKRDICIERYIEREIHVTGNKLGICIQNLMFCCTSRERDTKREMQIKRYIYREIRRKGNKKNWVGEMNQ